jgi:hypothetical protein
MAPPREILNFSVVFEPNSKFHSPQKDVFAKHHDIFSSIEKYVEFEPNSHRF